MNYVYAIYNGKIDYAVNKFLNSLKDNCDCKVLFNYCELDMSRLDDFDNVEFIKFPKEEWDGKQMSCKIKRLLDMKFEFGDKVFVLDCDLLIQDDIFDAFDGSFDVCITGRHYDYWYPINGGVWGFEYNDKSKRFLEFFVEQIYKPTWKPFYDFQKKWKHLGNLGWWCDQDFLCVLPNNDLPFDCIIKDLGYKYNYCPSVEAKVAGSFETASADIETQRGNKEYKVLHFKGRLKEIM